MAVCSGLRDWESLRLRDLEWAGLGVSPVVLVRVVVRESSRLVRDSPFSFGARMGPCQSANPQFWCANQFPTSKECKWLWFVGISISVGAFFAHWEIKEPHVRCAIRECQGDSNDASTVGYKHCRLPVEGTAESSLT